KLCCGIKHTAHTFLGQVLQGRLTTPGSRQRNICAKRIRQNCEIDANLRHIAIRFCAREKLALALFDENMEHRLFKCRISGVTVRFPTAINDIELDAAADWLAAVYPDRSVAKIGSGLAIPGAKLDDVDLVGGGCEKCLPKSPANQRACSSNSLGIRCGGKRARSRMRVVSRNAAYRSAKSIVVIVETFLSRCDRERKMFRR